MRMYRSLRFILPSFAVGLILGSVGMGVAATIRGSSIFSDVPEGSFYDTAVGEMYSAGVIKGYSNGMFGPNDFVTRGQVAVMMQRFRADLMSSVSSRSSAASVSSSSSSSSPISSSSSSSSVTSVTSNVHGNFQFANARFSLPEAVPSLTLSIQRASGSEGDVTVRYTVKGGTATAGEDFVASNQAQVSFRDGETSKNISVTLKDDLLSEGSETVIIELSDPTGGASLGSPSTATLTVLDNEAPSSGAASSNSSASQAAGAGKLEFSALAYEALENSAAITITVVRTGGSSGQVGVTYATSDKTARAGSEYNTTTGTLTFNSGETIKTFSVPLIDDTSVDGKKALDLKLSAPTGGAGLGVVTSTLSIADDEIGTFGSGSFMFSKSSYQATEGDGIAIVTVNRVGGTKFNVSVNYATVNGSALPGQDYTNTSGTLSFAAGEQSKTFTIPILRDSANDSGEYFTVNFNTPIGAVLGDPATTIVNVYE